MTKMLPGQYLESPSRKYRLQYQDDCQLVLLDEGVPFWFADKNQAFGRIYKFKKVSLEHAVHMSYYLMVNQPCWSQQWSSVGYDSFQGDYHSARQRAYLQLQDDGNIVVIEPRPLWSAGMSLWEFSTTPVRHLITPGFQLERGATLEAGGARLALLPDQNLVGYDAAGRVVWASNTEGSGADFAVMQSDGNFVLYAGNTQVWATDTAGNTQAFGQVHEDGRLSIVYNLPVWARFGIHLVRKPTLNVGEPYEIPISSIWKTLQEKGWI